MSAELDRLTRLERAQHEQVGADIKTLLSGIEQQNAQAATSGQGPVQKTALERWSQQVRAMATHSNPTIRKIGTDQLQEYHQRATDLQKQREKARSEKEKSGVSWPEYYAASKPVRRLMDRHKGLSEASDMQKLREVRDVMSRTDDPNQIANVLRILKTGKDVDTLTGFENTAISAMVPEAKGQVISKNIEDAEILKKTGQGVGDFLVGWEGFIEGGNVNVSNNKTTMGFLDKLKDEAGHSTIGMASLLSGVHGTSAKVWSNMKDVIQSRLTLETMSGLKRESATGSTGFGALSERELSVLEDYLGKLDQSSDPASVKEQIGNIYHHLATVNKRIRKSQRRAIDRYEDLMVTKHKGTLGKYAVDIKPYNDDPRYAEGVEQ